MKFFRIIWTVVLVSAVYSACRPTYETTNTIFYNLNDGALLVRLYTKSKTIEALAKQNPKMAEKVKLKQEIENAEIVDAFKKEFKICPVYYFYSHHSKQVKAKQFEGVLLDENLNPLKQIPDLNQNYFIAEFSHTKQDTTKIKAPGYNKEVYAFLGKGRYENARDDKGNLIYDEYDYYSTSMEGGLNALIVLSPEFIQLQAPYPHYIRTYENLWIFERSKSMAVYKLNQNIEFYLSFYKP